MPTTQNNVAANAVIAQHPVMTTIINLLFILVILYVIYRLYKHFK